MHFACGRFVAQASSLWGKQASSPAKETAGKMPACSTAKMAVLRYLQRCEDFDRQCLRLSCRMKIYWRTFVARKYLEKSSRNAARIFFPEIGGTKNRGPAPSGICNCKIVN
jgi:hypothetical protein